LLRFRSDILGGASSFGVRGAGVGEPLRRRLALAVFCIVATLSMPSCASSSEEPVSVRIAVLGSSTAAGIGPKDARNAWVNRYRAYCREAIPGCDVVNLGRDWFRSYQVMPTGFPTPDDRPRENPRYNITKALSLQPSAIIINLPSNDTDMGYSLEEQVANFRVLIDAAAAQGVPLWVATPQPRNDFSKAKRRELVELREAIYALFGDRTIDFWTELATPGGHIVPAYHSGDEVHLNDEGHRILFERVRDARILEHIGSMLPGLSTPRRVGLAALRERPRAPISMGGD